MSDLPCPPAHWSRFSTLLDEAMDLAEPDRDGWLRSLDGEDADLRPWLARVLGSAASVNTGDFLNGARLPDGLDRLGSHDSPEDFSPGDTIGPYRLESILGQGGMGHVWRATRGDDGPSREVALKLPHAELLGGPFRARFARERDVLAGLSHPNIAALYDAGVSATGHPYLALELVSGQPITTHCQAGSMPLDRRVDLVRQVLAALGYAHARLIVHRDIKPSNVLVTPDGQVKLLDFGIAKLLDPAGEGDAMPLTQPASRMATPGYAPPEQMEGGRITVAADLFAAGVLLFELCTGQRPPRLRPDGEAAPLASGRADAVLASMPEPARLRRRLRGDLDAIIARALAIDPAQRYGSADAFARDLRRWQDGLPVSARRIGPLAVAAKFARRNRAAMALSALLVLALAGGTSGVAWQASRAEREAVHAEREAARAEREAGHAEREAGHAEREAGRASAIKDFLINLFRTGDAAGGGKRLDTMTARDMLDSGADRADAAFPHDPATEIELLTTLGNIYDWADEPERAGRVWRRRMELSAALYGPDDARVIDDTLLLANSDLMFMNDADAKLLLERIRRPVFTKFAADSLPRASWLQVRARSLRATHGGRDEALADDLAAIAIFRAHFPGDLRYHDALEDLEGYQYDSEQYAASIRTLDLLRANEIAAHRFDPGDDLVYHSEKASRLERLGRFAEASEAYEWAQAAADRQFGRQSLWYIFALNGRAQMLHLQGDREQAMALFRQALGIGQGRAAVSGQSASLRRTYGAALAREGRAAEAVPILEQVLRETRLHGHDEQNLRRTEGMLGDAYDQAGRAAEARPLLLASRDEWLRYGPEGGFGQLGGRERWARFLLGQGELEPAAAEFSAILAAAHGRAMAPAALAEAGLARVALARGSAADAAAHSLAAMKIADAIEGEFDVRARIEIRLARATALAAGNDADGGLLLAQAALRDAHAWDAPGSPRIARAASVVAGLGKAILLAEPGRR